MTDAIKTGQRVKVYVAGQWAFGKQWRAGWKSGVVTRVIATGPYVQTRDGSEWGPCAADCVKVSR